MRKGACFREGDNEKLKIVNERLKSEIREAKDNYKTGEKVISNRMTLAKFGRA